MAVLSPDSACDAVHVLSIEGFCSVPWMEKRLARASGQKCLENDDDERRIDWSVVEPAWENIVLKRMDCYSRNADYSRKIDTEKVKECKAEISTGLYHAIVVVDLCKDCEDFEKHFGSTLKTFARDGGVVAFPATEYLLIPTINKLFSTRYGKGDYLHTKWEACQEHPELVARSFARGNLSKEQVLEESTFESRCVCLLNVPPKERCYGITASERSKMMNPMYGPANDEGVMAEDAGDAGYPVCIAVHDYGQGCVGYFGDQSCVETTLRLIASFLLSRAPFGAVDSFSRLDESSFDQVLSYKAKGNKFFSSGNYAEAISCYDEGLARFGNKAGKNGSQRKEHVHLLSNRAECCLRLKQYDEAEKSCTKALELQGNHGKTLLRRAKARLYLTEENSGLLDKIRLLEAAERDIRKLPFESTEESEAAKDVLEVVQARLRLARKKYRQSFKDGFSSAVGNE